MDKIGWFEVRNAGKGEGELLEFEIGFFSYDDFDNGRIAGTGDSYYADATLDFMEFMENGSDHHIGHTTTELSVIGNAILLDTIVATIKELDEEMHEMMLSDILAICSRRFDEGRGKLHEKQREYKKQQENPHD